MLPPLFSIGAVFPPKTSPINLDDAITLNATTRIEQNESVLDATEKAQEGDESKGYQPYIQAYEKVRIWAEKATQEPIPKSRIQEILRFMEKEEHLLFISVDWFPGWMINNTELAQSLFEKCKQFGISDQDLLESLFSVAVEIQVLEFVTWLVKHDASKLNYLHEFMHALVQASLPTVESRKMKWVFKFLLALFQSKTLLPQDYTIEIPPLCLSFSRLPEAVALYKVFMD